MREKEEEVSTLLYKVSNKLLATEQLQKSKQDLDYCQRRTREVEVIVLKDRPLLVQAVRYPQPEGDKAGNYQP